MSPSVKIRNHVSLLTSQDNLFSSNGLDSTTPTIGQASPLESSTSVFDDKAMDLGSTTAPNSSVINFTTLTLDEQNMIVNVTRQYPFDYATIMLGYIMPFVLVLTIISNTLVVMVLAQRHMRTPTNIVLFTMAIVDLMTLLSPSPWYFYIYTLGYHDKFLYPPLACYAHHIMTDVIPVFFHTSSIWLALLLASQRYIYVCHPTLATTWCTVPRVRKAITIILVVALVHQFPRFFDSSFVTVYLHYNQSYHPACKILIAEWVNKMDPSNYYITYFTFRILFVFTIPCVALITLNCLLFKALRRAENKRTELLKTKFKIIGANHCSIAGSATGAGGTHSTKDPQHAQQTTQTGCQTNTDPLKRAQPLVAGGRVRDALTTHELISRECGERCGSLRKISNDVSGNGGIRSMDKRRRKFSIGSFRMKRYTNSQRSAIPASNATGNISGKLVNQNGDSNVNDKSNYNNTIKVSSTTAQSSDTKLTMTEYEFDQNDDVDNLNVPVTSGRPPVSEASSNSKYQSDVIQRPAITSQRSQESNRSCPIATMRPLKDEMSEGIEGSREVKRDHLFVRNESDEVDDDIEEDNDDFTCHECVAMCEARHDEFECQRCRAAAIATDGEALPQPPDGATDTRHLYHQSSSLIGGTNNTNSNTNEDTASSYGVVTENASSSIFHQHSNTIEATEAASLQDDDNSDDDDVEIDRASLLYEGDVPSGSKGTKSASTSTNRRRGIKKSVSIDSRLTCGRQPQVPPFRSSMNFRRSSSIRQRNDCRECCLSGSCRAPGRRLIRRSTIDPPQVNHSSGGSDERRMLEVDGSKCVPSSCVGSDPCAECTSEAQKCNQNQAISSENTTTNNDHNNNNNNNNNKNNKDVVRPVKPTLASSQSDYGRTEAIGVDRKKKNTGINIFPSNRDTVATTTPTTTTTTTLHSTTANSAGSLLQAQQQQQQQNSRSSGRRRKASQLSSVVQTHMKNPSFASTIYGRARGSSNLPPLIVSGGTTSASLRNMDSNRTTLMLIVVVTVFLMVEVPVAIVTILHVILNTLDRFEDFESLGYIKLFTNFFIMISYSVNFTIYCSMSKKFRETFRDVFLCGRRAKRKRVRRLLHEQHRQHQYQQQQQQQYQQHQFNQPEHLQTNNTAAIPSITGNQANQNDDKNAISDTISNTGLIRFYRRANSQQQECEL